MEGERVMDTLMCSINDFLSFPWLGYELVT
jgi:hypothetical protein